MSIINGPLIFQKEEYKNKLGERFFQYKNDFRSVLISKKSRDTEKQKMYYVSVPPGAGKTEWAKDYIYKNSKKKKYKIIYAAPTKELLNQTFDRILELNPKTEMHLVHSSSETYDKQYNANAYGVSNRIATKIANMKEGDALFITHAALLEIDHTTVSDFYLIFDEASDWEVFEKLVKFGKDSATFLNRVLLYEAFRIDPTDEANLKIINPEVEKNIFYPFYRLHIHKDHEKEVSNFLKTWELANPNLVNILRKIKDDTFSMYARSISVHQYKDNFQFAFLGFNSPKFFFNFFKKVVFMAAFFEQSLLYNFLLKHYDLKEIEHLDLVKDGRLIEKGYRNLEVVSIFDIDKPLSKNFLKTNIYVDPKAKHTLGAFIQDCRNAWNSKGIDIQKYKVSNQILQLILNKNSNTKDMTDFSKKVKSILLQDRIIMNNFKYVKNHVITAGEHLQNLVANDLKDREKNGFKVRGKVLFLSNVEKQLRGELQEDDFSLNVESLIHIFHKYEWLNSKSHGINKYRKNNLLINLAAFNPTSVKAQFYKFLFGPDFSPIDLHTYLVMQGVTRTRIRNPGNTKKVIVYVFSTAEAKQIQKLAPRCKISTLNANVRTLLKIDDNIVLGKTIPFTTTLKKYESGNEEIRARKIKEIRKKASKIANSRYRQDEKYKKLESKISYTRKKLKKCSEGDKIALLKQKNRLLDKLRERRKRLKEKDRE